MPLADLLHNEDTLALVVMGTIALTWIVSATVAGVMKTSAREKSRREIAAFIAEGSISPEQGERLMRARDK
ncbi:MAG: hypothetical protein R3B68_02000 [Phycisphaerales bacterium]